MSNFGAVRIRNSDGSSYADPADGALPTYTKSSVSTLNSTSTPLSGSATFTGDAELCEYPYIGIQSFSDVDGTLFLDFSIDGTNWDSTYPVNGNKCSAGVPEVIPAAVFGRYFRVRYVNGSDAQSVFRLATYKSSVSNFFAALNQPVNLDSPAILTRSTFTWLDSARGLTNGFTSVKKFGRNPSVGTSYAPVSLGGIYRTPQSGSATTVRVKAGNANDAAAGTGARSVTIVGLDENFNEVTETLTTAGASASSNSTTTFTRIYRAFVATSGTYATSAAGSHSAAITIENSAGTEDWITIDATNFPKGQTECGAYSIPTGKTGYIKLRDISIDSGKTVDIIFFSRTNIQQTAAPYDAMRAQSVVSGVTGGSIETFGAVDIPFGPYTGPTDIGFMAKVTTGTASVSVEFEIFILDE